MDYDVCVIGSGAGGASLAADLAWRGRHVVLLELGRRLDPKEDFAKGPRNSEDKPLALGEFEPYAPIGQPIGKGTPPLEGHDGLRSFNRFVTFEPAKFRPPAQVYRVLGLGGSTLHFQGCSDRWAPESFAGTALEGEDLAAYYALAESRLRVHGSMPYHKYPAHQLGAASQRMLDPFKAAGLELHPSSLAIHARPDLDPGRSACVRVNRCSYGCPNAAKSSYDLGMLAPALMAKPDCLEIRTRSLALRLLVSRDNPARVEGVEYADLSASRPVEHRQRVTARQFVVCAGPVETPRLLLLSNSSRHPDGIGNSAGLVGRNVTEMLFVAHVLLFQEPLLSFLGPSMESMAETTLSDKGVQVTVTQEALQLVRPLDYARRMSGHAFGPERLKETAARYGRAIGILIEASQQMSPENRVALEPSLKDPFGRPAARIDSKLGTGDLRVLESMAALGRTIGKAAGVPIVEQITSFDSPPGGSELRGSCRMDRDPAQGVVDERQRVHGMDNLFIADTSVMPSCGQGNPSLTTAALALRLSRHLDETVMRI